MTEQATAVKTPRALIPLLATGMALSMFVLYAIGALGPFISDDLGLSRAQLGLVPAVAFGTATVLSLAVGHLTDLIGARRAFLLLLVVVAADFAVLSLVQAYWLLLLVIAVAGVAQSLANPSTNLLIVRHVPGSRRALAIGIKQSGVPLAALVAGIALPSLAQVWSWRTALLITVPVAVVAALFALTLPADNPDRQVRALALPARPNVPTRWLMVYSLAVGCGLSALNTYLPLYAHRRLGLGLTEAGGLISAIGVAGFVTRLLWARYADRLSDVPISLLFLAVAAGLFGVLIPAATTVGWLVWVGAVGVGGFGAVANAVTMVAVTKGGGFGQTGHASALVSMGFFAGFVVGPIAFGLLTDGTGSFRAGWIAVSVVFAVAALMSVAGRRSVRAAL